MLTSSETQQKLTFIKQENANVIAELGKSILSKFSHNISHEISEQSLKIHYTLGNTEGFNYTDINNTSQVLCNFLQFYIVANFIFPYHSNSPAEEASLTEQLLSFKIRINNTTKSTPVSPSVILSQISFNTITIVTPLKSVISSLIASELKQHSIIKLKQPFILSFTVTFNIPFNLEKLNHHLTSNLPIIKDTSQLYHILDLYRTFQITNTFPETQPTDLKLAVFHTKNPQSRTPKASISTCLITSTPVPTMFIKYLCNIQYNHPNFGTIYEVAHQKLNTLPNLQECSLKLHSEPTINTDQIYELQFSNLTGEKFCKEVFSYINLFRNLYDTQISGLSIEFLPKKETKADPITKTTAPPCLTKLYPLDFNTQDEVKKILLSMCDILEKSFISQIFFKERTDQKIMNMFNQYNMYLHITPNNSMSKSIPPSTQTSPSVTQEKLATMHFNKQIHQISQEIKLQEKTTHTLSDPTTNTSSHTQPSTSHAVTPTTRASSSTTEPNLQEKCKSFSPISQTNNYTKTAQQGIPTLRKVTKPSQTNKPINKNRYKKNMIFAFIGISIFTAFSILVYCALSNKFLANYTDITKINQVVMLGILCLGIIVLIGTISYYHIKAPNNLVESTTGDIQQYPQTKHK